MTERESFICFVSLSIDLYRGWIIIGSCVWLSWLTKSIVFLSRPGTCLTNDIDTLLYHMNNSRYFRELDFARADFFERTGLYRKVLSKGGEILQGAATIRYRRYIRIFSRYKITTKVSVALTMLVMCIQRFVRLCPLRLSTGTIRASSRSTGSSPPRTTLCTASSSRGRGSSRHRRRR